MKALFVYDDHVKPNAFIRNIIGEKTFGEVILKRESVKEKAYAFLARLKDVEIEEQLEFSHSWQMDVLLERVRRRTRGAVIVHLFSGFIFTDEKKAELLIRKLMYAEKNYVCICEGVPMLFVMTDTEEYCRFLKRQEGALQDTESYTGAFSPRFEKLETDAFLNIGEYENFLRYISGGFDVRFFNSVKGDDYTVVKSSGNRDKIRAEYRFFHLLPDEMKRWFVMPYDYREDSSGASYRMERYHVPDLAVRWVHGAISLEEMDRLLTKVFHFISTRKKRNVSPEDGERMRDSLYLNKVESRMEQLKEHALYPLFDQYISGGMISGGLDGLLGRYRKLYRRVYAQLAVEHAGNVLAIGHGDLCFSNMLYNRDADLLKLIDPKGAEQEEQLWTDPYYDVAKLSHSVCGLYDFFNSGQYQVTLDERLRFQVEINFDNSRYKELFQKHAEGNGYSYLLVRLYEASLFLSMLPLHMDNPRKVFGFILNAEGILEEVETCLKS